MPPPMLNPTSCHISPLLEIPAAIQTEIFPCGSLSQLPFLQFPWPTMSTITLQHKAIKFFSHHDEPTAEDVKTIPKIPISLVPFLQDLVMACKVAVQLDAKSVQYLYILFTSTMHLPMWVLVYW